MDKPLITFQELETVLRILDASPRNGTVDITVGDLKLSVTRSDAPTASAAAPPIPTAAVPASAAAPASAPAPTGVPAAPAPAAEAPSPAATPSASEGHVIESPLTGVFYRQPSPDAPTFVDEGAHVEAGDVVAIIEVMKLMNRLTSPVSGTVTRVCAENEQLVEHGTALFVIEPDGDGA